MRTLLRSRQGQPGLEQAVHLPPGWLYLRTALGYCSAVPDVEQHRCPSRQSVLTDICIAAAPLNYLKVELLPGSPTMPTFLPLDILCSQNRYHRLPHLLQVTRNECLEVSEQQFAHDFPHERERSLQGYTFNI